MRVLLVRPKLPKHTLGLKNIMICEPLELEYLAGGIGKHDVKIVDEILGDSTSDIVRQFKPDVVGTSSYITGVNEVRRICRMAKRFNPDTITVVGGVHATVVPEDFCRTEIDMIVIGEGIETFRDIIDCLERGGDLEKVPGVAFPDGETLRIGPLRVFDQGAIDRLPFPRRDLTVHNRSKYYYLYHRPVTIMKTAFGCPFRCTFCFCWKITNGRHLVRSPESIADELENIETDEVYIVDDTFLFERKRLLDIVEIIRRRNIRKKYLVYGRSDFIAANEDVISEWADIGLKAVIVGIEYTSDRELDSVKKRTTKEENDIAIEVLRRNCIDIYASFILGMEYDRRDFKRLSGYIEKKQLFYFVLQPLTPLPGTEIFKKYEHLLIVDRESYPIWDLTHVVMRSRLTPRQFYWQMAAIYVRYTGNFLRIRKLGLRTVQSVFKYDFLRLMAGAYRILISLLKAHRHHRIYRKNSSPPRLIKTLYSTGNFDGLDVNLELTAAGSKDKPPG